MAVGVVAGCGSSSSSSSSGAAASATSSAAQSSASPYGATKTAASGSTAPGATAVTLTTKHAKVGTILAAGQQHLTVYLFEADKGPHSSCTGACAAAWPPVLGKPAAIGGAMSADMGTITRADGKTQVTYKGHPLYFFVKDKDGGDAYGEGVKAFGASWYVLRPNGTKVDES
jgi:predicted lipoprotein with Yx(FWY)xxD motif